MSLDNTTGENRRPRHATEPKMVKGIVAPRRTVCAPGPEKVLAGYDDKGEPILRADLKEYGPGEEVEVSIEEAKRLRAIGYLIDPEALWRPTLPEEGGVVNAVVPDAETKRLAERRRNNLAQMSDPY